MAEQACFCGQSGITEACKKCSKNLCVSVELTYKLIDGIQFECSDPRVS